MKHYCESQMDRNPSNSDSSTFSNYRIVIITLIPLLMALLNLYLRNKIYSVFTKYTSIASIATLVMPAIFRNYTSIGNDFDYKMITLANLILLFTFIINCFVCQEQREFIILVLTGEGIFTYMPFIISAFIDILLSTMVDRALSFCYKILTSLALMIILIGSKEIKLVNIYSAYWLFVIPSSLLLGFMELKEKFSKALTMTVMYCIYVSYYAYTMKSKDANLGEAVVKRVVTGLSYYIPAMSKMFQ